MYFHPVDRQVKVKRRQRADKCSQCVKIVAPQEKIAVPNYEEYKQTAQQKIQQEQAQILENVLTYTGQELSLYLKENELQLLCEHI